MSDIAAHETLFVVSGGPATGVLMPGRIQRALANAAGVQAEEIGTVLPAGHGRVAVEVAWTRARWLSTPLCLPIIEGNRRTLLMLTRQDDPPEEDTLRVMASWDGDDPVPPGALAAALAEAIGPRFGAEELGIAFHGDGWARLALPDWVRARDLPSALEAAGRKVELELLDGKKNL